MLPRWIIFMLGLVTTPLQTVAKEAEELRPRYQDYSGRDRREVVLLLETYLRMKNGKAPSRSQIEKQDALHAFTQAFTAARTANQAIGKHSHSNCQEFLRIYGETGLQILGYASQLINTGEIDERTKINLESRLEILRLFEAALFSMALIGAEAGQSTLDPRSRATCTTTKRTPWLNLLMQSHQRADHLLVSLLGEESALTVQDRMKVKKAVQTYDRENFYKTVAFVAGELVTSIVAWEKMASPALRTLAGLTASIPVSRAIMVGGGVVYMIAWVAVDRFARHNLSFLKTSPSISKLDHFATFEQIMSVGEEFLYSNLNSPSLYLGYLDLISLIRQQRATHFIDANFDLIAALEEHFGSAENALVRLKEELKNENENMDHRREPHLDAPGARPTTSPAKP